MSDPTRIVFVCLGNICRSPLAEGLFVHLAHERGVADRFVVDSCGTGDWHVGNPPDPRSVAVAAKYGVELPSRARTWDDARDPEAFDLFVPMDGQNKRDIVRRGAPTERVRLMREWDAQANGEKAGGGLDVPDPYYGGDDGFDKVYAMLRRSCEAMLDELAD